MWCRLILLAFVSNVSAEVQNNWQNENVTTQIFTGTVFDPIQLWIYESSIPLIFKVPININFTNITDFENTRPCQQDSSSETCKIEQNLQLVINQIKTQLLIEQTSWETEEEILDRTTRGITVIGRFFKWCCDLATQNEFHGVVENEQFLTDNVNSMVDLTSQDHENIILTAQNFNNFTRNVHNMSNKIHDNIKTLQKQINNLKQNPEITNQLYISAQTTIKYLFLNYFLDNLRDLKTKCLGNKIPHTVITKDHLREELSNLDKILATTNQKPAIDFHKNLDLYYKLPISACFITKSYVIIKVQIPINFRDGNYKTFKNIPIPLFWQNQTCYVTKKQYTIVTTGRHIYVINNNEKGCNENSYPLCLLPRQTISGDTDHYCIKEVLRDATVSGLKKNCEIICHDTNLDPIITKLLTNKFLITNTHQDLRLECPRRNESKLLPQRKTGTIELLIPCDCQVVLQTGEIILSKIHPCDESDHNFPQVTHLVPSLWMNIQTLKLKPLTDLSRHSFIDESEIINPDWQIEISTLKLQDKIKVKKDHIKLLHSEEELFNNNDLLLYIVCAWLATLTVLVILAFYCVLMNNAKLSMVAPPVPPRAS